MLSRDTIALVETDGAALELCRIVEGLDSRTPSLCTIVRLGFPPFAIGVSIRHSYWSQEVVPAYVDAPPLVIEGRPPRRIPFHHSPEEVLVAMVISDENIVLPTFVALVTRLRTLVALATTTPPGVTFIPWENWGPRATACFELPLDLHSRVDAITGVRCTRIREGELSILDFNSMRIRDAMQRNRNSSGRPADVTTVGLRSIIARGRHFREDVVSELPYICFNVSASPLDWNRIVIYEEGPARLSSNVRGRPFPFPLLLPDTDFTKGTGTDVLCPAFRDRMSFPKGEFSGRMAIHSHPCPYTDCRHFDNWHDAISLVLYGSHTVSSLSYITQYFR